MNKSGSFFSKYYLVIQVACVLAFGVGSALYVANRVANNEKNALINRVQIISKTLHRSPITRLNGDETDLKSADYNYLKKKMVDIKSVNPDARFVYLMGYNKELNKLFFLVDSELPGSKDYSPPGQVYEESTEEQITNFTSGVAFAEGPYKDRWGKWVTASAPILSPDSGLPIAMIGIDIAASKYIGEIAYAGAFSLIISILLALFFVVVYRIRMNSKNIEINNIKMEFSSFMSHEIRGFVTKMRGGLSMLYQEELGKLSADQQSFINNMLNESDDFAGLVEEFLDIAHLEQDTEIELKKEESNLIDVIKGVEGDLNEAILKKDLTIVHEGNLPDKIFVLCDSNKIGRVFSNILSNAIKYSPERTSIRIGYIENNLTHTIYIKDSGIGIPPQEQANMFKKFYRATNARQVHISGTGLGLYFTKLIVEKHGGKIWFESVEGRGTTFFVSLPKKSEEK
ncbi:MAG TPA: HAMP domain-containing sensor histidine kinase [Candidatus Paceibacterota bacterium]|nr:HAMP domain-containing sensor histidine kinase [Candidatus Paceibacterota bacterium]